MMLQPDRSPSPWLTVTEAAERARCGRKTIYKEIKAGRLRAATIGSRRDLRILADWVDKWLIASSEPIEVRPLREVKR